MLPSINGEEVCQYIRQHSDVPILILSAKSHKEVKVECMDNGADDYLAKPFDLDELLARVRALLRRSGLTTAATTKPHFVYCNLSIDFNARQVIVSDKEIQLTPKEYELLKEIAMHQGNVIAYDALLSAVWGEKYRGEKGYIHNFMYHLRAKIEPDPNNPRYIISSPGFGYYFNRSKPSNSSFPT